MYNMLIKGADTIAYTYPFPAKIVVKNSTLTLQERGCYFLWLTYSKMATIRIAKVSSTINSSYVLIENASFRSRLRIGGIHTLSAPLISILCFHGSGKGHLSTSAKLRRLIAVRNSDGGCHLNSGQSQMGLTSMRLQGGAVSSPPSG